MAWLEQKGKAVKRKKGLGTELPTYAAPILQIIITINNSSTGLKMVPR